MLIQLSRWQIEVNPEATRDCYSRVPIGTGCSCDECRNFDAAAGRTFPQPFIALTTSLGVDPEKPAELMHWERKPSGLLLTGGWFHFVGAILEGRDLMQYQDGTGTYSFETLVPGLEYGVTCHTALVHDSFAGLPVVQLEFQTLVPWVLGVSSVT